MCGMNDIYNFEYLCPDGRNYIHKTALIGHNVELGKGNIIMPYAVIGEVGSIRDAKKGKGTIKIGDRNMIGPHVTIMTGDDGETKLGDKNVIQGKVNIGHNCIIGDENEIGCGTIISGFVNIGNQNKIKLHCSIRNRITIGDGCLIGMGSNVIFDVYDEEKIMGNPAR